MIKKSKIIGDVQELNNIGADDYLSDNYDWPVSDKEFKDFVKYTHYEYLKIINSINDKDLYNIAIVELSFIAKLQQILHCNYVKNYSIDNNIDLITSEFSREFYYPDWNLISKYYSSLESTFSRPKKLIRRFVKNIIFNKHMSILSFIKFFFHGSEVVGIGSNSQLKQELIIKKNFFCDHVDSVDLYSNITFDIYDKFTDSLDDKVIMPFINRLKASNKKFINSIDLTLIRNAWKSRFFDATCIYFNIKNNNCKPVLLVAEMSKPLHKLITVAYQQNGCKVYCFHHGHDAAVKIHSIGHDITSMHCLNYVAPSHGIIYKYKKVYPHLKTKYFSTESNWYKHQLHKNVCKTNNKINSVMLIGFPFNAIRYVDGSSGFFYSRVDLEIRLIKFLKNNGFKVVYKLHPDRMSEAAGLYDHLVDELISTPFEKTVCSADCFLFTHSSSTTFGYALTTNKPVLLLDINLINEDTDSYELLKKRVDMVPSYVDKSTRIFYDEDILLKKLLKQTKCGFDNSFFEKMFFPVNDI